MKLTQLDQLSDPNFILENQTPRLIQRHSDNMAAITLSEEKETVLIFGFGYEIGSFNFESKLSYQHYCYQLLA